MPPHALSLNSTQDDQLIDARILRVGLSRRSVMFSHLAETLHDCTWHRLFAALARLKRGQQVELIAHRLDYEIRFLETSSKSQPVESRMPNGWHRDRHEKRNG